MRMPIDAARRVTGGRVALQGNLDPVVCLAGWEATKKQADEAAAKKKAGRVQTSAPVKKKTRSKQP